LDEDVRHEYLTHCLKGSWPYFVQLIGLLPNTQQSEEIKHELTESLPWWAKLDTDWERKLNRARTALANTEPFSLVREGEYLPKLYLMTSKDRLLRTFQQLATSGIVACGDDFGEAIDLVTVMRCFHVLLPWDKVEYYPEQTLNTLADDIIVRAVNHLRNRGFISNQVP